MKSRNIMHIIRGKEYTHQSDYRRNLQLMKVLACDTECNYKRVWQKSSNASIAYDDGRLYFDNYRTCYSIHGALDGSPPKLYSSPRLPASQKIRDALTCICSLDELPMDHHGWRNHLLAITAHNWLKRIDTTTGSILQQVFLTTRYKFRHISWDNEQSTFTVKSTHIVRRPPVANQNSVVAIALFKIFPLEFQCMFEVTRSIFGSSTCDAMVSQGALIILHSGGMVRIYSMEHIIEDGLQFDASLHQYCKEIGGVVGTEPFGIPTNIHLSKVPPVMFEVRCADHYLTLGGIPWHYIISVYGMKESFKVYSLENGEMVKEGNFEMNSASIESDKCMFHMDNSGRILHFGPAELRLLKLHEQESAKGHVAKIDFAIKASDLDSDSSKSKEPKCDVRYSSSGRQIKVNYSNHDTAGSLKDTIAGIDFENELDLLTVTSTHMKGDSLRGFVHLINNDTGETIKRIPLEDEWKEDCDNLLILDMSNLIHIVNGPMGKYHCSLYRLERQVSEPEEKSFKSRKKGRKRSYHPT